MLGMTHLTTTRSLTHLAAAALTVGALTLAVGCGDDDKSASTTSAAASGTVVFTGQWARTSPSGTTIGAAYATITSPVDDVLTGVSVDASVAKTAELHEMVMASGGSDTTMSMGGSDTTMKMGGTETTMPAMTMQPVDKIELTAGKAVELKPGGYHIMLMDLAAPLKVGDTIKITFTFEKAGAITIDVPVLDEAP